MPKIGANDMPVVVDANSEWADGYSKGLEQGYRAGCDDALRQIKEALYKLYGNSMKPLKGREDGDN